MYPGFSEIHWRWGVRLEAKYPWFAPIPAERALLAQVQGCHSKPLIRVWRFENMFRENARSLGVSFISKNKAPTPSWGLAPRKNGEIKPVEVAPAKANTFRRPSVAVTLTPRPKKEWLVSTIPGGHWNR